MNQESMRELLARLHERLSQAGSVDAESRVLLATVLRDIERALGGAKGRAGSVEPAAPRLEALAVQFEAEHPAIAQTLWQLVDALGKAGI